MAKANGDPHVEAVQAVATTHAQALRVATPGDRASTPGSEPVYLILLRGSFTAYDTRRPSGAPFPTGSFLCVVVDQKTFWVTDWGLSRHPPQIALSSLGSVARISLGGRRPVGEVPGIRLEPACLSVRVGTIRAWCESDGHRRESQMTFDLIGVAPRRSPPSY